MLETNLYFNLQINYNFIINIKNYLDTMSFKMVSKKFSHYNY